MSTHNELLVVFNHFRFNFRFLRGSFERVSVSNVRVLFIPSHLIMHIPDLLPSGSWDGDLEKPPCEPQASMDV